MSYSGSPELQRGDPPPRRNSTEYFDNHVLTEDEVEAATNIVRNLLKKTDRSRSFTERACRREKKEQLLQKLNAEIKKGSDFNEGDLKLLEEAIQDSRDCFQKIENAADGKELNRDAHTLEHLSTMLQKMVNELASSESNKFKASTFARKVKLFASRRLKKEVHCNYVHVDEVDPSLCLNDDDDVMYKGFGEEEEEEYPNDYIGLTRSEWALVGRRIGGFLHKGPKLIYMAPLINGATKAPEAKPKKERVKAEKRERVPKAEQVVLKMKDEEEHAADEMAVSKELDVVRKALRKALRRNDNVIEYYRFVLDPDDFAKTVENIFHTSFLIKDGMARLALNDNGLPTLSAFDEEKYLRLTAGSDAEEKTLQAIMQFDMYLWKEMKAAMNVTEAMIP